MARAVDRGDFRGAEAAIAAALADPTLGDEPRQALAFERERMRRIGLDFKTVHLGVAAHDLLSHR